MRKTYGRSGNVMYDREKRPTYSSAPFELGHSALAAAPDPRAQHSRQESPVRPEPAAQPDQAQRPEQRNPQSMRRPDRRAPVAPNTRPISPAPNAVNMPRKKKPAAATSALRDLMFLLVKLGMIGFVFVLLFTFLFGVIRYQDSSMDPAIKDGDIVLFFRTNTDKYHPRDVVILDFNGKRQVRRVIATAGDTVDITEDGLLINGALQQEQNIYQKTVRYQEGVEFPLIVPEGHIFVMGDARRDATDSRIYGCVRTSDTYGKAMAVLRRRGI